VVQYAALLGPWPAHQPDVPHGPQLVVGMPSLLQAATTGFDPRSLNALPSATAFAALGGGGHSSSSDGGGSGGGADAGGSADSDGPQPAHAPAQLLLLHWLGWTGAQPGVLWLLGAALAVSLNVLALLAGLQQMQHQQQQQGTASLQQPAREDEQPLLGSGGDTDSAAGPFVQAAVINTGGDISAASSIMQLGSGIMRPSAEVEAAAAAAAAAVAPPAASLLTSALAQSAVEPQKSFDEQQQQQQLQDQGQQLREQQQQQQQQQQQHRASLFAPLAPEAMPAWGGIDWARWAVLVHMQDAVLVAVLCACAAQRDLLHAGYLAIALVLFRRRGAALASSHGDEVAAAASRLALWLPGFNFAALLVLLLYQV
jgi:hypothetical protein